jgi:hypothetical protein
MPGGANGVLGKVFRWRDPEFLPGFKPLSAAWVAVASGRSRQGLGVIDDGSGK